MDCDDTMLREDTVPNGFISCDSSYTGNPEQAHSWSQDMAERCQGLGEGDGSDGSRGRGLLLG